MDGPPGIPGRPRPAEPNDSPGFGRSVLLVSPEVVGAVIMEPGTPLVGCGGWVCPASEFCGGWFWLPPGTVINCAAVGLAQAINPLSAPTAMPMANWCFNAPALRCKTVMIRIRLGCLRESVKPERVLRNEEPRCARWA